MSRRSPLFLGLFACLLVAVDPLHVAAGDGQVIQQVSANGQRNLRPFTVTDKGELQWDSKGSILAITVYKADGTLFDVGPMQKGPGSGSSYQPRAGTITFKSAEVENGQSLLFNYHKAHPATHS
jgi:hypothetical protein